MDFVPDVVTNKARAVGATKWLDDLPSLLAHLCQSWDLTIGRTYVDATEAFVCEVVVGATLPAVLKLVVPRDRDVVRHEITVLQMANGESCASLLRSDVALGALLLERLGPTLESLHLPMQVRHEVLCSTVERLWRPAPDADLPTVAQKAAWLGHFITTTWEQLNRPCSRRAIDVALTCADERARAFDEERSVLVHGDLHQWNTLRSGEGFKLIDPDGLLVEAEYDLGIIMREDPVELLQGDPTERARWLARRCGLDVGAIWQWGVVERVSTGLLATQVHLEPLGRQMLHAADVAATLTLEF